MRNTAESRIRWMIGAVALLAGLLVAAPAPGQGRGDRPRRGGQRVETRNLRELQPAIDGAIDRGVEYLLSRQLRDGSWDAFTERYGSGQTALSLYTLLKSQVPPTHPAIEAGFARLDADHPTQVYTVSCHLLAYGALEDPAREDRMRELLHLLLEGQDGSFGYHCRLPGTKVGGGIRSGKRTQQQDLSNTQFAALGLRAAKHAGLKIPTDVWRELIEATLEYQESPRAARTKAKKERTTTGAEQVAGFCYRTDEAKAVASGPRGSMTAAGVGVLEICREGLGTRLTSKVSRSIDTSQERALNWLAANFSATRNPGGGSWLCYYLYGLERVGGLLGIESIGDHDWYLEGARQLLRSQDDAGSWGGREAESDSCFALLFLQRATAPTTGKTPRTGPVHVAEGAVHLRATGTNPLVAWITGFDEGKLTERGLGGGGWRVAKVEYLVDGNTRATLDGEPRRRWRGERYAWKHTFEEAGLHQVSARVHVIRPEMPSDETIGTVMLEADGFEVQVDLPPPDWMVSSAHRAVSNSLRFVEARVSASSGSDPNRALDDLQSTAWLADPSDLHPSISLRFPKPVRADTITLAGPDARAGDRGQHDTIARAVVTIDGKQQHSVRFPVDPLEPATLELKRSLLIQSLEIELIERVPGSGRTSTVGLAEIGLFLER